MPVITSASYFPSAPFRNKHFNTIYPSFFRSVNGIRYERVRIETPDNDFIDLDFSRAINGRDAIQSNSYATKGNTVLPLFSSSHMV